VPLVPLALFSPFESPDDADEDDDDELELEFPLADARAEAC
jgi:hypothetical protein